MPINYIEPRIIVNSQILQLYGNENTELTPYSAIYFMIIHLTADLWIACDLFDSFCIEKWGIS